MSTRKTIVMATGLVCLLIAAALFVSATVVGCGSYATAVAEATGTVEASNLENRNRFAFLATAGSLALGVAGIILTTVGLLLRR